MIEQKGLVAASIGTFDKFHEGHDFLLRRGRWYLDNISSRLRQAPGTYIVFVVPDDIIISYKHRPKGMFDTQIERATNVLKTGVVDRVIPLKGAKDDMFASILEVNPDMVIFGHDQRRRLDNDIRTAIWTKGGQVVKVPPYKRYLYSTTKTYAKALSNL